MMEIYRPALLLNVVKAAIPPTQQVTSLKPGAIHDVIVRARLGENRFQLQLLPEGDFLTSISQGELSIGQRLQVKVVRMGTRPELRILAAEARAPDIVSKALSELIPKQIYIKELTSLLKLLPTTKSNSFPGSVRLAAENLTAALPLAEKLMTPDGLRKIIQNSGLFLEASLAAVLTDGAAFPENDLKACLLKLLAVIQNSDPGKSVGRPNFFRQETSLPPIQNASLSSPDKTQDDFNGQTLLSLEKLAQKAEGALAKITVDQLVSQPRDNGALSLQMNIPIADDDHHDNAKLLIASESAGSHDERINSPWTATIELQPPGMGSFNARIVWNGERIDACLWSDREETSALMRNAVETLRARLEQAGLKSGALTILDRPPPSQPTGTDAPPLLDLRA